MSVAVAIRIPDEPSARAAVEVTDLLQRAGHTA